MDMNINLPTGTIIKRDEKNHTIYFLKGANLSAILEDDPEFRKLQSENRFPEIANAFMSAYRTLFLLANPSEELTVASVVTDDLGLTHVKLRQAYKGIPVWAAEIIVHLDRDKHIYLAQGRYIPTPVQVNITPALSKQDAERIVAREMKMSECSDCLSELVIYPEKAASASLAWRIEVFKTVIESWTYFINADTGAVMNKLSTINTRRK